MNVPNRLSRSRQFVRYIFIGLILLGNIGWNAAAASSPGQLVHFPVMSANSNEDIQIKVTTDGLEERYLCYLYYRKSSEESYQHIEMEPDIDGWQAVIPADVVRGPEVEYFVSAVTSTNHIITSPVRNPYFSPYKVKVNQSDTPGEPVSSTLTQAEQNQADDFSLARDNNPAENPESNDFLILSPETDQILLPDEVVFAASFISLPAAIDWKSLKVYLNKKSITRNVEKTQGIISYMPKKLKPGRYNIKLVYRNKAGKLQPVVARRFSVADHNRKISEVAEIEKPYSLKGNIFTDLKYEEMNGEKLETNIIGGNILGRYQSFRFQSKLYFTSRESNTSQPRNRYLIGFENKWLGVKFGDTNPRFHELMLWGSRVRGIEAFIKTGFFNLEFVTGETRRAVKGISYADFVINPATGDTIYYNPNSVPADTVNDGNTSEYKFKPPGYEYLTAETVSQYGTYQRILTGIRSSFGSGKNFQLGFNLVKTKDQVSSIDQGFLPKDNLVVGSDLLIAFDNHRIEFSTSVAFSLLTEDISNGSYSKAQIDSTFDTEIPFDPSSFDKYLILNASTNPLDPTGMSSLAYKARLRLNYFNNALEFQYKSIGPEYHSLGNTFLKNDIQGFAILDRFRLLRNRLILNLEYSQFQDGFFASETPATDLVTFNFGATIFLPQKFPRLTFSYRTHNRNNGVTTEPNANQYDSRIKNSTNDLSLMMGYDLQTLSMKHSLNLSLISSKRIDGFDRTIYDIETDMKMFSLNTRYAQPFRTTISFATNANLAGGGTNTFEYNMLDLRGEYFVANEKFRCFGGLKNIQAKNVVESVSSIDYTRKYLQVGIAAKFRQRHSATFSGYLISYSDNQSNNFTDKIFQIRYDFRL